MVKCAAVREAKNTVSIFVVTHAAHVVSTYLFIIKKEANDQRAPVKLMGCSGAATV